MSAADRLRALDAALTGPPWEPRHVLTNVGEGTSVGRLTGARSEAEQVAALRNALPFIADVIEAAEADEAAEYSSTFCIAELARTLAVLRVHLGAE